MLRILCLCLAVFFLPAAALAEGRAGFRLLKLDGQTVKWGEAAYGQSSTVTYALLARQRSFDDARNCRTMGPVDHGFLTAQGIAPAAFEAAVAGAFDMWQAAAGVMFVKAADPATADILIGVDLGRRGWAHADVRAAASDGDIRTIKRSLICLNPDKPWKIGFGRDARAQDLRYTLSHEIGHAIGLNHPGPHGAVMSFRYDEDFENLQPGDINGARILYGPAADPDVAVASTRASRTP